MTGRRQIYIASTDGRRLRPLLSSQANDDSPAWSPDGQRIAFASDRASPGVGTIYVYDLATGMLEQLTGSDQFAQYPAWRPQSAPGTP